MKYNQRKTIKIGFIFTYEDVQHLLSSVISFVVKNYNQSNDAQIRIFVTIPQDQSFTFSSLEDFTQNFSRSNRIISVSFEMFFNDPVNTKEFIFIDNHFISKNSTELNVSSYSQPLSQDLVDWEATFITQYINEKHPRKTKNNVINKIDNVLNSKFIYMVAGALITAAVQILINLFTK